MGTKFSSIAISGYNSSPPSDDGATNADNQLQWAKHLSKIGNPIKTAVESINTALVTALDQSARSTSSTTTAVSTDHNRVIEIAAAVSTGITISLSDAATMADGYIVNVHNLSSVQHTLARVTAGDFINGVASDVPIAPFSMIKAWVNAAENGYLVSQDFLIDSAGAIIAGNGQIKFPATQNASTNANTLDDYEEGTWTPGLSFNNGTTGITYFAQSGKYTKIGRMVLCEFQVVLSNKGSSVGNARITGLPFSGSTSALAVSVGNWNSLSTTWVNLELIATGSFSTLLIQGATVAAIGNATQLVDTDFGNGSIISASFSYFV